MSAHTSISVVIATYNRASFILETLHSIIGQTRPPDEIIVIDDGSTDETAQVVESLGARIIYRRISNQGPLVARAQGVKLATGDYVAVVDDDDLWLPDKMAKQLAVLQESGCAWVYGDAVAFDHVSGKNLYRFSEVCKPLAGFIFSDLLLANFIPSPTVVIQRSLMLSIQQRSGRPNVRFGEDWMTWLLAASEAPVALVHDVVARYRIHDASAAARTDVLRRLHDCEQVLDFCRTSLGPSAEHAIARARGLAQIKAAVGLCAERQLASGLALAMKTVIHRPYVLAEAMGTALRLGPRMLGSKLNTLRKSTPSES